jgi:Peptidase family S41
MWLSDAALGMLFDRPVPTIAFAERADPTDHFKLRPYVGQDAEVCGIPRTGFPPTLYIIDMCDRFHDPRSYDRPIAVLTGPNTVSAGDQVALRMTLHPRARTFGKPTNGAFSFISALDNSRIDLGPGWSARYAAANSYLIADPHDYLTHREFPVDEPVWLQPDDVAQGKDTVVDAALQWINSQTP